MLWKQKVLKIETLSLPEIQTKIHGKYTKNEKFLERTTDIKKIAKEIKRTNKSEIGRVESAFNYVIDNFTYCYPVYNRGVSNLDFNNLKGDCGEYSSVFVALCRQLSIPARNNTGFVIIPKKNMVLEHGWASVYFKKHGWIDFDTQYASLENPDDYFAHRSDYRITFTNGFSVPLLPNVPNSHDINYWKKIGLPITNRSVQTLQPLVYTSDGIIHFEDSFSVISSRFVDCPEPE